MSDNMKLWDAVCTTLPSHTKKAKIGQMSITAICPQSQRKFATEQFGPFGMGWGLKDEKWEYIDIGDTKLCHYTATLWYVLDGEEGEFPVNANVKVCYMTRTQSPYLLVDDEYAKKVQTNALTKGLSALGFNSDVFEGKYDDNHYVAQQRQSEKEGGSSGGGQKSQPAATSKASPADNERSAHTIMATLKITDAHVVEYAKCLNSTVHTVADLDAEMWEWLASPANMDKVVKFHSDRVPS